MKALRFDNDSIKAVARLVELHMRFYGYGDAGWTRLRRPPLRHRRRTRSWSACTG